MIDAITALTRPLTTLGLVGALIYLTIIGRIGGEQFFTVVTMVVGFWFGTRGPATGSTKPPVPETNGTVTEATK